MASAKSVASLVIALTIAATLLGPFYTTVFDNTGDQSVVNESVNAQVDEYVELNGYTVDSTSETVYWYNNSSGSYETVSEGSDYEFAYDNGSVKALSSGDVGDGDKLKVSYDYEATDGTTTTVLQLTPMFMALLMMGVLAGKLTGMM